MKFHIFCGGLGGGRGNLKKKSNFNAEEGEGGNSKTNNFNYSNGLNCLEIAFLSKCHERDTFGRGHYRQTN